jgi:hypothetical protein
MDVGFPPLDLSSLAESRDWEGEEDEGLVLLSASEPGLGREEDAGGAGGADGAAAAAGRLVEAEGEMVGEGVFAFWAFCLAEADFLAMSRGRGTGEEKGKGKEGGGRRWMSRVTSINLTINVKSILY